jgi:hypothetical protein
MRVGSTTAAGIIFDNTYFNFHFKVARFAYQLVEKEEHKT